MGIQRLSNLSGRFIQELEIGLFFPNRPRSPKDFEQTASKTGIAARMIKSSIHWELLLRTL